MKTVADIMTRGAISVSPQTPIVEAIGILLKNGYSGLPVVNDKGVLIGIVNEYNFIVGGSSIHLPTLLKLFEQLKTYKKDHSIFEDELKQILSLTVYEVMNNDPLTLKQDDPIEKANQAFGEHHTVNPIPVVDDFNHVAGIVSRSDLLKFFGDAKINLNQRTEADIEKNISAFIDNFDKKFVVVSKGRTRFWWVASIFFVIVGFAIAWLLILRIV